VIQFLSMNSANAYAVRNQDKENAMDSNSDDASKSLGNAPPAGASAEAYARWLEHMQRTRGRHAAITRNLYTWSNYKSWADKVKGSFAPSVAPSVAPSIAK
jgi:hypothetical protein